MRIRKRQVPLPLSSLSPIPLSDLFLNRYSLVQSRSFVSNNVFDGGANGLINPEPSDHQNHTIGGHDAYYSSDCAGRPLKHDLTSCQREGDERKEDEEKVKTDNHNSGTNASALIDFHPQRLATTSKQGEYSVPLKKGKSSSFEVDALEYARSTRGELLWKKSSSIYEYDFLYDQEDDHHKNTPTPSKNDNGCQRGKKKTRGGGLLEGSRCSRVNGRGWRCCQQTLVGYSLCEHHLGKGRLRSVTNVRSKPSMLPPRGGEDKATEKNDTETRTKLRQTIEDQLKMKGGLKKRIMKLGMVKARSINSLLGQASNKNKVEAADHFN